MDHSKFKENQAKPQPVGEAGSNEKKPVVGVVTGCFKLNLRKRPDANADVITVIEASTEVAIDMDASTPNFYKVCTAAGIEGFCMRKYVTIRK